MATPAQQEFNDLVAAQNRDDDHRHPEDRHNHRDSQDFDEDDLPEEDAYRAAQIDAAMRVPALDRVPGGASSLNLPPASFDDGRSTGVKGVIADARSYQSARQSKWRSRVQTARQSIFGLDGPARSATPSARSESESDEEARSVGGDEESFLQQWRETRRRELEAEASRVVRNRRTSPSMRMFGRLDEVDAMGYLDAIEKVGRETKVAVFVYDHECEVSATIESALLPLVHANPTVHFVKVHYEDIEFDPAAVPSLLAYRHQGDLFANLTGIIELVPDDDGFGTPALETLLRKHDVL